MSEPPKRIFGLENAVFVCCMLAGALVLFVWSCVVGGWEFQEPNMLFYFFGLLAVGAVGGGVSPRSWWTCWAGVYFGQSIAYALIPTPHPSAFWGLGFFFLLFFSLITLPGAVIGALLRVAFRRIASPAVAPIPGPPSPEPEKPATH